VVLRDFSSAAASTSLTPPMRPRRALLYMPGSSPKMLQKATTLQVDTVCMDLEDAVAENKKAEARGNIVAALNGWPNAKAERLVRINPVGSGFELDDIRTILTASLLPDGIVLPKVESAEHVQWLDAQIVRGVGRERAKDIIIIALIESVEGMVREKSTKQSGKIIFVC
jgi:citrate lyase subunit beta-like protein